jgi:hypothetical protein
VKRISYLINLNTTGLQLNNNKKRDWKTSIHKLQVKVVKVVRAYVIACCNAEGTFIPPAGIMEGVRENVEFSDCLPPSSSCLRI